VGFERELLAKKQRYLRAYLDSWAGLLFDSSLRHRLRAMRAACWIFLQDDGWLLRGLVGFVGITSDGAGAVTGPQPPFFAPSCAGFLRF
jgi:hypothetical protein